MNLPKPANNLASLQAFHDKLESHMRALQSLGKSRDSYCAMLTPMVLGKLPLELKKQFAREHSSGGWTIKDIVACILKEIRVLELGYYSNSHSHSTAASFHTAARKPLAKQGNKELACTHCNGPHTANQCTVIKDHQQRTTIVKAAGLCFNCLANHRVSQCTSRRRCKQCNQKHHTSLCPPAVSTPPSLPSPANSSVQPSPTPTNLQPPHNNSGVQPTLPPTTSNEQVSSYTTVTRSTSPPVSVHSVCLLKTAITTVSAGSISTEGNILFDEGAQHSFISQKIADRLSLHPPHSEQISLSSFGNLASSDRFLQVATILVHTQDRSVIPISVLVVPQLAAPLQNSVWMEVSKMPYLKHLQLAHPVTEDDSFEINILVGADYYWTFVQDQVICGDGPAAVKSRLGYLLSGPLLQPSAAVNLVYINFTAVDFQNLDTFWKLESSGTSPSTVDSGDNFLKTYMQTSIACQPNGALSLKFPWKEDHPFLPSNFSICAKRTRSLAHRLAKDPELLSMYGQIIADQESKGFIEKVDNFNTQRAHYIPHRAVRKDSATTPVRIVYDCSCRRSAH